MQTLSTASLLSLYLLLLIMALYLLLLIYWQLMVLRGKSMKNPDGSVDDWHQQRTHYGIAFADLFIACPINITGIILVFVYPVWGYYILAMVSFWWLWAGVMTTSTSLRFEKPEINIKWFLTFPLGVFIGVFYIIWTLVHFELIYIM